MIAPSFKPVIGGAENAVENLTINLNKIGIKTDVMTFNMASHWNPKWEWEIKKEINYDVYKIPAFNPFIKLNIPDPISYLFKISICPDLKFREILDDYDVLHFHDVVDLSFPLFSLLKRKPRLFHIHTFIENYNFYKYNILSRYLLLKFPDLHITASKRSFKCLKGLGAENVEILPYGVDPKLFTYNENLRNENTILFLGRFEERKGLHILLDALSILNDPVKLIIVGPNYDDKYSKRIFSKIDEINKLKHDISYLGPQSKDDLINLLKMSTILAFPSLKEDFGIVILEAMSCGIPIIASDLGGVNEMIKDLENGVIVPPGDPIKLAESIQNLLNNEDLMTKLSINGRKIIEDKFSWDSIAKKFSKIYQELIDDSD